MSIKTILSFFATPLMQVVSKAPMIKPPITRTNVLKMNNNFKQALNLYGYVVSYEGDGYRVETEVKEFSPFNDMIGGEMAETILLSSFITYEHSLGIEADLKQRYDLEQKRRKERNDARDKKNEYFKQIAIQNSIERDRARKQRQED